MKVGGGEAGKGGQRIRCVSVMELLKEKAVCARFGDSPQSYLSRDLHGPCGKTRWKGEERMGIKQREKQKEPDQSAKWWGMHFRRVELKTLLIFFLPYHSKWNQHQKNTHMFSWTSVSMGYLLPAPLQTLNQQILRSTASPNTSGCAWKVVSWGVLRHGLPQRPLGGTSSLLRNRKCLSEASQHLRTPQHLWTQTEDTSGRLWSSSVSPPNMGSESKSGHIHGFQICR